MITYRGTYLIAELMETINEHGYTQSAFYGWPSHTYYVRIKNDIITKEKADLAELDRAYPAPPPVVQKWKYVPLEDDKEHIAYKKGKVYIWEESNSWDEGKSIVAVALCKQNCSFYERGRLFNDMPIAKSFEADTRQLLIEAGILEEVEWETG